MKTLLFAASALAALSTTACAGTAPKAAHAAHASALVCPVTGTKIASPAKAYAKESYKGKTYYFCCPECKPAFDKHPDKTITDAAKGKYQPM